MRAWAAYAAVGGALLGAAGWGVGMLVAGSGRAVWIAAAVAYTVQLVAFGLLVAARRAGRGFAVGWGAGTVLRFLTVGVFALVVTRGSGLPPEPALLGLVGFMFVLVLLEPIFLRIEG